MKRSIFTYFLIFLGFIFNNNFSQQCAICKNEKAIEIAKINIMPKYEKIEKKSLITKGIDYFVDLYNRIIEYFNQRFKKTLAKIIIISRMAAGKTKEYTEEAIKKTGETVDRVLLWAEENK